MGGAASSSAVTIDFKAPPSTNPFLNKLLRHFENPDSFPGDIDEAIHLAVASPAKIEERPDPAGASAFAVPRGDPVLPEIIKGLEAYYPDVVALRDALVPKTLDSHEFWSRLLRVVQHSVKKELVEEKKAAIIAVRKAAIVCSAVHKNLVKGDTQTKDDKSPVTIADFASQAIVVSELLKRFPTDQVVGEEDASTLRGESAEAKAMCDKVVELANSGLSGGSALSRAEVLSAIDHGVHEGGPKGRFWTLDPIDGTKGFIRGEQYAVCLALIEDGEVILGVLGCPNLPLDLDKPDGARGALYVAVKGHDPEFYPIEQPKDTKLADEQPKHVKVSSTDSLKLCRFTESVEAAHSSHSHAAEIASLLNVSKPPCRMDSQCKYAAVARGDAEIYLRLPTRKGYEEKIWDHAGGALIVRQAGGTVTDIRGHALDFSLGRTLKLNSGVIATNGLVHADVLRAVRAIVLKPKTYTLTIDGGGAPIHKMQSALAAELGISTRSVYIERQ